MCRTVCLTLPFTNLPTLNPRVLYGIFLLIVVIIAFAFRNKFSSTQTRAAKRRFIVLICFILFLAMYMFFKQRTL